MPQDLAIQQPTDVSESNPPIGSDTSLTPEGTAPSGITRYKPIFGDPSDGESYWGNATIETTVVKTLDLTDTTFNQTAFSGGLITTYILDTTYAWDEHTLQMPVACASVRPASFAVVGNETLKRIVNWSAEKVSSPPTMPDPDLNNPNSVLLTKTFKPVSLTIAPDSVTFIYTITGTYVYGIIDAKAETMFFGVAPYVDEDYGQTYLGPYQHGLIDEGTEIP